MDDVRTALQRIERLTPLADVLTAIDAYVMPIAPREIDLASAVGGVLANDVRADRRPPVALVRLSAARGAGGEVLAERGSNDARRRNDLGLEHL